MADSAVHKCKTAGSLAKLKDQMSEVNHKYSIKID